MGRLFPAGGLIPSVGLSELFSFHRVGNARRVLSVKTAHARGDAHAVKRLTFGRVRYRKLADAQELAG